MKNIVAGKCYYHKKGIRASVRKVLAINNGKVEYEVLYGPQLKNQKRYGNQRIERFQRWVSGEVREQENYTHLDGCVVHPTFLVRNTRGEVIFRCGTKRAKFYLRKGYANEIEPGVLQFTNDVTESRLVELYGNEMNEFWMEVKNDRCVCCGSEIRLTRHHVIPTRMKKQLPQPWRSCISNILFLCMECHSVYEQYFVEHGEPDIKLGDDPLEFAYQWRDHFMQIMKPKHIPKGWDIVTVKNIEAARRYNVGLDETGGRDATDGQAKSA